MKLTMILAAVATIALVGGPAQAQERPERPDRAERGDRPERPDRPGRQDRQRRVQLAPEAAEAAWTLQAKGVAGTLELDADQTTHLVKAYTSARRSFGEAMREAMADAREPRVPSSDDPDVDRDRGDRGDRANRERGQRRGRGGGGGGQMNAVRAEVLEAERGRLDTSLQAFLSKEQAAKAMLPLGTFNPNWDIMVDAIAKLELEDMGSYMALNHIETYVTTIADARLSGDRRAIRQVTREARQTLASDLGAILSEEQMEQFRAAAMPQRGRGQGNMLERFDANGDGKLQIDEVPERMQDMFDRLDANGDGAIDAEEMAAMRRNRGGRRDRDNDN